MPSKDAERLTRRLKPNLSGFRFALATAFAVIGGCSGQGGLPPAAYKAPKVGMVYKYSGGITNRITSVDGYRIGFVDGNGNPGSRIGLFISENPASPVTVDQADLDKLWPLILNKERTFTVKHGAEEYRWHFRITSEENGSVAGKNYPCYVVQAVQEPVLVRNPKMALSTVNTWWYSPDLNAVVRFKTTYNSGPTASHVYESELENMGYGAGEPVPTKKK